MSHPPTLSQPRLRARRCRPGLRPTLETLEDRLVLAGTITPNGNLVQSIYQNVLGRLPDASAQTWISDLNAGASAATVAQAINATPEAQQDILDDVYAQFLQRSPDSSGNAYWMAQLVGGASTTEVLDGFLGSPEYSQLYPTDAAFLTSLYSNLLDRSPDAAGLALFQAQLSGGASRAAVAQEFLSSSEYEGLVVQQDYGQFLARPASAAEVGLWVNQAQSGVSLTSIANQILGSAEFTTLSQGEALDADSDNLTSPSVVQLGSLSTSTVTQSGTLGANQPDVIYQFTVTAEQGEVIALTGVSAAADVQLAQDLDSNGVLTDSDVLDEGNAAPGSSGAMQDLLEPGTYYVRVLKDDSTPESASVNFTLSLFDTEPNAQSVAAATLGSGTLSDSSLSASSSLSAGGQTAEYGLFAFPDQNATFTLSGLSGGASLALYHYSTDANGNAQEQLIDTGEVNGSANQTIAVPGLEAGVYALRITSLEGATAYQLNAQGTSVSSGDTSAGAASADDSTSSSTAPSGPPSLGTITLSSTPTTDLGTLGTSTVSQSGTLAANQTYALYQFTVTATQGEVLALTGVSAAADLEAAQDLTSSGTLTDDDVIALTSATPGASGATSQVLDPGTGTYYPVVLRDSATPAATPVSFTLSLIDTDQAAQASPPATLGSGILNNTTLSATGNLASAAQTAEYDFSVTTDQAATLTLSGLSGGAALALYTYATGSGGNTEEYLVDSGTVSGSANQTLNESDLPAGQYALRVTSLDGATPFQLTALGTTTSPPTPPSTSSLPALDPQYGLGLIDAQTAVGQALGQTLTDAPLAGGSAGNNYADLNLMHVGAAWNAGITGKGVTVAVIDTGVDGDAQQLQGQLAAGGYNFLDNNTDTSDLNGHGTAVAGVIAAKRTDDASEPIGIAPGSTILAEDVLGPQGEVPLSTFDSNLALAINYAVGHGARVINLSLGSSGPLPLTNAAIQAAIAANVVAAAGNEGDVGPLNPAAFASGGGVIAVGAVDDNKNVADFSNGSVADPVVQNFVVAPGVNVRTLSNLGQGDVTDSGTSLAAPYVSGLAALVIQANPNLTAAQVVSLIDSTANQNGLEDSSVPRSPSASDELTLTGRIQAAPNKPKKVKDGVDLAGADLTGADLTGADLTRARLTGANLTDANLTDAGLDGAHLPSANLTRANLTDAYLPGASLDGAILTNANLTNANLTDAYLDDAILSGAFTLNAQGNKVLVTRASLSKAGALDVNNAIGIS